jgi:hypothetical protein
MFGNHELLERKLRKNGKAAAATVLSSRSGSSGGNLGSTGAKSHCKLTVSVQPDGEPAFEATVDGWLVNVPKEGALVPVLYDPADHQRVVIDHHRADGLDPAFYMRSVAARAAARRAESGTTIAPEELGLAGSTGTPAVFVGGQPVRTADPAATADALTKLADLRDRGALTDEEFAAQKKKLLDS